jgi:D-serine deaminase-like pyridoxal phosphate-dependent protein
VTAPWHTVENLGEVDTPALLVYPDRVEENIRRMVRMAGSTDRLRPHIKTHKMPEVMRLTLKAGLSKYKCATIAEAEMAAQAGAADVLLAHQPVGPKIGRLVQLIARYPGTKFSTIADDAGAIRALAEGASEAGVTLEVLLDIDNGMHRCGVPPGEKALALYTLLCDLPSLIPGGLHVYDGHITESDPSVRRQQCDSAFEPVSRFRSELGVAGLPVPRIVAGGTPTFPIHAGRASVECSPGTCIFSDAGYGKKFPDLGFLPAVVVATRVISQPGSNRFCLDLGHKAIASENPHPRLDFLGLPPVKFISHSEEHLVIEMEDSDQFSVGSTLYGLPWHVCPTCALHSEAVVIREGRVCDRWKITARDRKITV